MLIEVLKLIASTFPIWASLIAGVLTIFYTKKAERDLNLRERKFKHYQECLLAISDLAVDGVDKIAANQRFSHASNTVVLVAAQNVVEKLMTFHNHVSFSNQIKTQREHDRLLIELVLAMRKDLNILPSDDPSTFDFHLIGSAPKKEK